MLSDSFSFSNSASMKTGLKSGGLHSEDGSGLASEILLEIWNLGFPSLLSSDDTNPESLLLKSTEGFLLYKQSSYLENIPL